MPNISPILILLVQLLVVGWLLYRVFTRIKTTQKGRMPRRPEAATQPPQTFEEETMVAGETLEQSLAKHQRKIQRELALMEQHQQNMQDTTKSKVS